MNYRPLAVLLLYLLVVHVLSYCPPSAPSTTLGWLLHYLANSMRYFFMLWLVARALEMQIKDELKNHSLPPAVLRMLSWFTIIAASWLDRQTSQRCDGRRGACASFGAFPVSFHICISRRTRCCIHVSSANVVCALEQLRVFQLLPEQAGNDKDYLKKNICSPRVWIQRAMLIFRSVSIITLIGTF